MKIIKCAGCSKEYFDIKELEKIKYLDHDPEDTRYELRCKNCNGCTFFIFLEDD